MEETTKPAADNSNNSSQLENALRALRLGFRVFPCQPRDKKPCGELASNGVKDATTDPSQIQRWWAARPDCNPGITGGVIVDCDAGLNSAEEAERWRAIVGLPFTFAVRTGRRDGFGVQFHFTGATENAKFELNGVRGEIRCRNQYGMAPGSIHPVTGERYEILTDHPRAVFPANSRLVAERKKIEKPKAGEKISKERNNWLISQVGRLVNAGLSGTILRETILGLNRVHCDPPLDEHEIDATILVSAAKFEQKTPDEIITELATISADAVRPEYVGWVWEDKIPRHAITIFAGNPDVGKTTIALDLVARVTKAGAMPTAKNYLVAGSALILSAEDDPAVDLVPKLKAADAALSRVHFAQMVKIRQGARKAERLLALDTDIKCVEHTLRNISGVVLIVIDPISAYFGRKRINSTQEAREVLTPLASLCRDHNVSIIAVEHFTKRSDVGAIHKTGGAVALIGAARAAFMFAKDPDVPNRYLMHFIKGNRSKTKRGITYSFGDREVENLGKLPCIVWGEDVEGTADEVLKRAEEKRNENRKDRATSWLTRYLADGREIEADTLLRDAKNDGISRSACYEAKEEVGAKARQHNRKWWWRIPVGGAKDQKDIPFPDGSKTAPRASGQEEDIPF